MTNPQRYTNHLDTVLALISNLALTTKRDGPIRTVDGLTREIFGQGADRNACRRTEIQETLDDFPGLFRKVVPADRTKETLYTLHLRWALGQTSNLGSLPPLPADLLKALLEFVAQRAEAEAADNQFRENIVVTQDQFKESLKTTIRSSRIAVIAAMTAAIIAAAASIVSAVIR